MVGDRILFREGRTKGLGIVKSVGYDPSYPLNPEATNSDNASSTANTTIAATK